MAASGDDHRPSDGEAGRYATVEGGAPHGASLPGIGFVREHGTGQSALADPLMPAALVRDWLMPILWEDNVALARRTDTAVVRWTPVESTSIKAAGR
jgi:hypothetical protein